MQSMKLGHAAAFAIVGWYLMVPPPAGGGNRLSYEPLSEWELIDTFDSRQACEQMRDELIRRMPASAMDTSRCISSDDPNLPKKRNEPRERPLLG